MNEPKFLVSWRYTLVEETESSQPARRNPTCEHKENRCNIMNFFFKKEMELDGVVALYKEFREGL